ncbi:MULTISPECIES: tyrosine--tRNA ligase [Streptomycetaceae]|uniref:Tyrosine--tRNA ligase n=1 Tax=Streptantibioticus cattleyicolor (strain ATCC 35852 / DSM 46488 / JCM 4925 / NBRC 14057 / NRRL 8057) TaxID=1003195 RepID=F8JXX5_STREN|nr:tyrosine--tRNA ligase [Streptantibioticus cattleyicolor]AEW93356.1 tyrosyl-tRNA synthetase [Streptantibioticus cattleyicolor NRRL 8057 = DSM 46488]MYS58072.1 tyrosine--tRNA ligase [Streptomyces sp. SID5468]CCB73712.1 Tyrosyl-tRNA synthetase [Streptantibioticus cattleyicolor NRRL 8057 = DSM 46488]
MTDIVDELRWRGVLAQTTDEEALRKALADGPVTLYCGFDPTAASLHVGHLTQIIALRRFQLAGHRPIALVGGATGLIGDPKPSAERQLNAAATVEEWVGRLRGQLSAFLDFDTPGPGQAIMANNYEWTAGISALSFLRDLGKHFSVNSMLSRETVKTRLDGEGMSYTEFSYVILQALDYVELYQRYGCTLQIGGSDQWGNITAGLDLIRRMRSNQPHGPAHALTQNLLTKADGTKFGKTEGGAVWLDPELTTPYAFYQFWLNTDDRDVTRYLRTFSFRDREEIEELERATAERPQARAAQRALAEELTTLVHGADQTAAVIAASQALFGQGDLAALDERTLAAALAELPYAKVPALAPVVDLLAETGLVPSKSAGRRTVKEGGAYVNNAKVAGEDEIPGEADLLHGKWLVLRRGKRNLAAVEVVRD